MVFIEGIPAASDFILAREFFASWVSGVEDAHPVKFVHFHKIRSGMTAITVRDEWNPGKRNRPSGQPYRFF